MSGSDAPPPGERAAYHLDGDHILPTEYATGPWFTTQQHGACVLGLLVRCLERTPSARPMRLTRVTADLSRAVPMEPCSARVRVLRDGRRVQSLVAEIDHEGSVVARAMATRIRTEPGAVPDDLVPPPRPEDEPPPFATSGHGYTSTGASFHDCLEVRILEQEPGGLGGVTWYRLAAPLVAGETPSPTVRVGSIADMVNSSAARLGAGWVSINPEVTLQVEREPVGEWLAVRSTVRFGGDGIGVSEGLLFDRRGRIGRSAKSVLNDRRP